MTEAANTSFETLPHAESSSSAIVKVEPDWIALADTSWACDTCNEVFSTYDSLLVHAGDSSCKANEGPTRESDSFCQNQPTLSISSDPTSCPDPKKPKLETETTHSLQFGLCQATFESVELLSSHLCYEHKVSPPTAPNTALIPAGNLTFSFGTFRLEGAATSLIESGPLKVINFKCGMCGMDFEQLDLFNSHVREFHVLSDPEVTELPRPPTPTGGPRPELQSKVNSTKVPSPLESIPDGKRRVAFDCNTCGLQFSRLLRVKEHIKSAHPKTVYLTNIGGVQIRERDLLDPMPKLPPRFLFQCEICKFGFYESRDYHRHAKLAHPGSGHPKEFHCFICNCSFEERNDMLRHFDAIHTGGAALFQCNLCVEEFSTEPALIQHLKAHPEKYTCSECPCEYTQRSQLWKHTDRIHRKKQRYVCGTASRSLSKPTPPKAKLRKPAVKKNNGN